MSVHDDMLRAAMTESPAAGAVMSHERPVAKYRYALWRLFDSQPTPKWLSMILINPSTADHEKPDPTLESCIRIARHSGYNGVVLANLFALRSSKIQVMKADSDPVGQHNDDWIAAVARVGHARVAAWGAHGGHQQRDEAVIRDVLAPLQLGPWHCLVKTSEGRPGHPLYLPTATEWQSFSLEISP